MLKGKRFQQNITYDQTEFPLRILPQQAVVGGKSVSSVGKSKREPSKVGGQVNFESQTSLVVVDHPMERNRAVPIQGDVVDFVVV